MDTKLDKEPKLITIRGGNKTFDRRLDRVIQFDERSRAYPIRQIVGKKAPRSYTWSCNTYLDQGEEGACVGFSWGHELAAKPKPVPNINNATARFLYKEAQKIDEWAGEDYDGTSVIAGAKVVQGKGGIKEYRWAFGLDDLILAIGYAGPAVLGLNWYSGMFTPDKDGYIHATGFLAGGHAILANAVSLKRRAVRLHNSWGEDWGQKGECWISFDDLNRLLHEQGEACIVIGRQKQLQ